MSRRRWLKSGILAFTLVFLMISTRMRPPCEKPDYFPLSGDTLACLIVPDDALRNHQYHAGYHYQILQAFTRDQQCSLRLVALPDSVSPWTALVAQQVRVMVVNAERDSVPEALEDRLIASPSLNSRDHAWVLLKEDYEVMQAMYAWFNSFKHTEQYAIITSKFYSRKRFRAAQPFADGLSPYDDIIKKYGKEIGWDWRLLAALIYQESNFRMGASSSKGAIGLMQVKKSVARSYGIDPDLLYDPEQNIRAGCLVLRDLGRQLRDSLLPDEEWVKFVLAAYNAGAERIRDCRNFALSQHKNQNIWDDVADVIPLMRKKEHYQSGHIRIGTFKGNETIRFVSEITERYQQYCAFLE